MVENVFHVMFRLSLIVGAGVAFGVWQQSPWAGVFVVCAGFLLDELAHV